jgi:hypothetical protein
VQLVFLDVSRFQFIQRDQEMPFTEDNCVSGAGYWTDEEWCSGAMIYESAPKVIGSEALPSNPELS